jgi:hypothetical protein
MSKIPGMFGGGGGAAVSMGEAEAADVLAAQGMETAASTAAKAGAKWALPKALGTIGKFLPGIGTAYSLLDPVRMGGGSEDEIQARVNRGEISQSEGNRLMGYTPQARATGGRVAAGVSYTVGEAGKETFTPSTNGTITPSGGVVHVQVFLDNEIIQDRMYKSNLRNPY